MASAKSAQSKPKVAARQYAFLGHSSMARLIASFDWDKTSLGPIETWNATIQTAVGMMLQSPIPIVLLWGPDGHTVYNDAYSEFAADRHPNLLGQTVVEAWPEIADFNRNVVKQVFAGNTLSYKNQTLILFRNNQSEEVTMDLSYSPILSEAGVPVGVMAIVVETTVQVKALLRQQQAEAELRVEQERLHSLFMEAPALIAVFRGPAHVFELANPLYMRIVNNRNIIGKSVREVLPELRGQGFYELLDEVYMTGETHTGTEVSVKLDTSDGMQEVYLNFVYQASHAANGSIEGVLVYAVDVTNQVKVRKRVEEQNRVLEMISSETPLPKVLEFLVQTVERQSPHGMHASILLMADDGKHLKHGAAPSLPNAYNKAIDGIAIGPRVGSCGTAAYTKQAVVVTDIASDPLWRDFRDLAAQYELGSCWSTPILSADQQVLGTFAIYYPNSRSPSEDDAQLIAFATRTAALAIERKKVETELQESERRFRFVVQNATDIITVFAKDGVVKYQSPSIARVLGRQPRPADGLSNIFDSELVHPDDKRAKDTFLKKIIGAKPDSQLKGEFRMRHADGSWHDIEAVGVNLLHLPQLNGVVLSSRDITDRKRSEVALRESEQQKTAFFETALDAIVTMNEQGIITAFNPAAEHMFGYSQKEAIGSKAAQLVIPKEDRKSFRTTNIDSMLNRRLEVSMMRADGTVFPSELTVTIINVGSSQLFTGTIQDITDRKLANESLKESERRFRTLADNIQNLAWIADPDGQVTWFNSQWYAYTGTEPKDALGEGWQAVIAPEELPQITKDWDRYIADGKPFDMLLKMRATDGSYRHFLTRVSPVRDGHGAILQWLGTNTDVEDLRQRHALEQRMERLTAQHDALVKINKTKDEFIALASHQLRTPATAVKQYIGVLLAGMIAPPLSEEQLKCLQTAYDSNERELNIINELLKTAQMDSEAYQLDMRSRDITAIVQSCIAALRPTLDTRDQKVKFHLAKEAVNARVDSTEIGLVFSNLLENASKYSAHGMTITVNVKNTKHFAEVSITDMGVGISKADQQRIFEKFTRVDNKLSDTVNGSGLGLYWVQQIVVLHNGYVTLDSTLGKGSTFTVRLPNE